MSEEQQDKPQAPAVRREERLLRTPGFTFLPQSWEQLYAYAKEISTTDFTPKSMRGQPGAVLAAWQKGSEVGLQPMASLESIAVINGVTSIHSNGFWALIVNHPLCEEFEEREPAEAAAKSEGLCTIKRRGNPKPITRRFTMDMAKQANLLGKDNWKYYPGRMLQQRARHLAASDAIPEAIQGLVPSEIAEEIEPRDVTPPPEPLKVPQPIAAQEKKENDATATKPMAGPSERTDQRPDDTARMDSKRARKSSERKESADTPLPPAEPAKETPPQQAEKSQEDIINECLMWVESCKEEDLFSDDAWIFGQLKKVKGTENQLKVLRPFNDRRRAIEKAKTA